MFDSESVGELEMEDVSESSDSMDSSLILVCSGSRRLMGRIAPRSAAFMTSCLGSGFNMPVDLEHGDSSIGVTVMREEGESKDCARMRTFGEGVLGGAIIVAMMQRQYRRGWMPRL